MDTNTGDLSELPVLRTRLAALAEREPAATAVDVAAARRAGGRLRRRRTAGRLSAAVMIAAVGVLCGAALLSVIHTSGGTPTVAVAPAPLNAQESRESSYPLAAGTDPIGVSGSFGWLPQGFTTDPVFDVSPGLFSMSAHGVPTALDADVTHETYVSFALTTASAGYMAMWISEVQQTTAETIRGRPASLRLGVSPQAACVTSKVIEPPGNQQPKDPVGEVTWTLADGRQASLQSCLPLGTSGTDATEMLLHVARTVVVTDTAVSMPFYLKTGNLPPSMKLNMWSGAVEPLEGDNWYFGMTFGPNLGDPAFSLRVTPADSSIARAEPHMPSCKVMDGLQVCVASGQSGNPLPSTLTSLGYEGLLDDIVALGTNPATWTTDVFR